MSKKILIIEDESDIQKILKDNFEEEGFSVLQATDGSAGLELALKEHPDLVLLDIIMPVMDGMTALKKMREDDWGKDVPVLILSNLSDGSKAVEASEAGVHDYLIKADWDLKEIISKVKERLGV